MSAYALAVHLRVPRTRIERLVREETPVPPDTALRLARYWGTTPDFWLGLQAQFDLETAQDGMSQEIAAIRPRKVA
jgi:antitoxin HigA-1